MERLAGAELTQALDASPGWVLEDGCLTRMFQFADFLQAIRFVNEAAALAEQMGHHPDIDIRYNRVRMALTTHDAGGITELDFRLAAQLSALQVPWAPSVGPK